MTIGSISYGTHHNEDLIPAFLDALQELDKDNAFTNVIKEGQAILTLWAAGWSAIYDDDCATEYLTDALTPALEQLAPPYSYFGAHEGDGSDFGFWPALDAISELPRVADPADVDEMEEDCVFINDHGNMTVYGADGSVIWDCV